MVDVSEIFYRESDEEFSTEEGGEGYDDFEALENAHFYAFCSTVQQEEEEEDYYKLCYHPCPYGYDLDVERRSGEDDSEFGVSESPVDGQDRWDGDDISLSRRFEVAGYVGDDEEIGIVGYDSESGSDGVQMSNWNGWDFGIPYSFESLQIDENNRDQVIDFEWDEIAERANDWSVLEVIPNPIEEALNAQSEELEDEIEEYAEDLDWEGLFVLGNLDENQPFEADDHDHFLSPLVYDVMFGQFADQDSPVNGNPPAAKSVVKKLPSIVITENNAGKNLSICAVCKDEIPLGATAKQLPCMHYYHGECILPWLEMRNTCPVCRNELPTNDPDHENQKA